MGRHMGRWAKELKVSRFFWHSLAVDDTENGQPESQPKKSTKKVNQVDYFQGMDRALVDPLTICYCGLKKSTPV